MSAHFAMNRRTRRHLAEIGRDRHEFVLEIPLGQDGIYLATLPVRIDASLPDDVIEVRT